MGVWTAVKTALGMTATPLEAQPQAVPQANPPRAEEEAREPAAPPLPGPVTASEPTSRLLNAERFAFGPRVAVQRGRPVDDGLLNEGRYEWRTFKSGLVNADRYEWRLPDVVNAAQYRWRERLMH